MWCRPLWASHLPLSEPRAPRPPDTTQRPFRPRWARPPALLPDGFCTTILPTWRAADSCRSAAAELLRGCVRGGKGFSFPTLPDEFVLSIQPNT